MEQVDRARAAAITSTVVRDQPNALAANELHRVAEQDFDAQNDAARGRNGAWRARRLGARDGRGESE
jgi:hypothetical protein